MAALLFNMCVCACMIISIVVTGSSEVRFLFFHLGEDCRVSTNYS